ncbi:hypothetical protein HNQ08_001585 [Deinococcus humi]|uniref:Uncharacterized protein n=1 Tax=Deinococcus humi TaxID=662880 RepID=A0A7W8NEA7_9DEIO|nr:hypothetical protein [Deinococcus humi]
MYSIGSHLGCGGPFAFELDWTAPTQADLQEFQTNRVNFIQLFDYLEAVRHLSASIELYNADEFWFEPLRRSDFRASNLISERFVFEERQHYSLVSP